MPANLTLQYLKAEQEYRRAATPEDELRCLQEMLRELPKHKGTDKLQADLKHKISKAKQDCDSHKTSKKKGHGHRLPRQGAGRVVLLGGPNAGKSQFVRATTRAEPEVAEYPFTTREPAPAMMPFEDVLIQIIDSPPITKDVLDPALQGLVRGADLALLLLDLGSDEGWDQCQEVLDHLAQTKTRLAADSYLGEHDIGLSFTQAFLTPNKIDLEEAPLRWELFQEAAVPKFRTFLISAVSGEGLDPLREAIFQALDVVRVYTKLPMQKEPDYSHPYTIHRGGTVGEVAALVHKDFSQHFKSARVWGSQVHPGTTVKADYEVHDKDVIELHM